MAQVGTIERTNGNSSPDPRAARLSARRRLKMARSAHAYVRGSTVKFYEWLENHADAIPAGPPVWICGDCHVGNLGPLADAKGRVAVQIRDLDQTVIGNPAHDLVRLGLSLASAARGSGLLGDTSVRILEALAAGYEAALAGKFDKAKDKTNRPPAIQALLARSVRRRWRHLAEERLDGADPAVPLGKKFWALSGEERAGLADLFHGKSLRSLVAGLKGRGRDSEVELVDAAYWVKGCSSLGRLRYAVMLRISEGGDVAHILVDVKEAVKAAAPRAPNVTMPRDNATRVVTGAQALSPHLGDRMIAARLLDRPVVLRELMPQDLKIEVDRLSADSATRLAHYLAGVVGRAHGRQMPADVRAAWRGELHQARTRTLDTPSWLWTSIVDLLSIHEAAYLDHCRRFALAATD